MSIAAQLALIFLAVALLVAIIVAVRRFARIHDWSPELQRKSIHVGTGAYALTFPWLFTDRWPVLVIVGSAVLILLALRLPALARGSVGETLHAVKRHSYGDLLLAIAIGIVFFLSSVHPIFYVLPVAVVTLSDAAAALTGVRYGRKFMDLETGTKSVEGSAMFFLVTWIVAMILLLLMTDIGRVNVVLLSLVVAAFGTLMEADSWHGFDNLFLPVGLHLFLWSHVLTPPLPLLGLTFLFLSVLATALFMAPKLGLSQQAARAYTIAIFLICAVADIHNAVLPIVAIVAHLAARRIRPSRSRYPDLDVLALVVVISVFWLVVGRYAHYNALNMYNLTFGSVALVFIVLAAGDRLWVIGAGIVALASVVIMIAQRNPETAQWHGPILPWIAGGFALCTAVAHLKPDLLDRYRGPRTLALALPVPLAALMTKVLLP